MPPAPKHTYEEEFALIRNAAIRCINETSVIDFTMSSLAKSAGLSMGSVYKHIQTKEDVFVVLGIEMYEQLHNVFVKILDLPLNRPVRLIGLHLIGEESANCFSFGGHLEMLITNEAILKRASSHWVEKMIMTERQLEESVKVFIDQSIALGELGTHGSSSQKIAEEILLGLWSMHVGFIQVARQRHLRRFSGKGVVLPFPLVVGDAIVQAQKHFLNHFNWQIKITDEQIINACEVMTANNLRKEKSV